MLRTPEGGRRRTLAANGCNRVAVTEGQVASSCLPTFARRIMTRDAVQELYCRVVSVAIDYMSDIVACRSLAVQTEPVSSSQELPHSLPSSL